MIDVQTSIVYKQMDQTQVIPMGTRKRCGKEDHWT